MSGGTDTQRGDPASFPADEVRAGFEPSDWPPGKVALALGGLVLLLVLSAALVAGFLLWTGKPPAPPAGDLAARPLPFPEPRLQVDEPAQRASLEALAQRNLAGGPGRIGIDRAMAATAAAGWANTGSQTRR